MIVSQFKEHDNGKWYLEVEGKPFLYNAIQSWYPPDRDFDTHIRKAAELDYKIFTLWLYWKEIEPVKGEYDFSVVDTIIESADRHGVKIEFLWAGTNFCDHMDPRFTPDWVYNNKDWLYLDEEGSVKVVNGFDMGDCVAADFKNEDLYNAERNILFKLNEHLEKTDKNRTVVMFQLENEFNINNYSVPKDGFLSYLDRLAGDLNSLDYRIATRVNIAMWKYDQMDPQIDAMKNVFAQGIDTYNPKVSYTKKILTDGNATKFRYVAENGAYENSTSHIVTALSVGAFYNVYKLDYDYVWDRPGAYGIGWDVLPVSVKLKSLNKALNNISEIITLASPENMVVYNTPDDVPSMYYNEKKTLNGIEIEFSPRNNNAVGMAVHHDNSWYLTADADAMFRFDKIPEKVETGGYDSEGKWSEDKSIPVKIEDQKNITYFKGSCIKITFRGE